MAAVLAFSDETLGNATCVAGAWCEKSGYRFRIVSACKQRPCRQFMVVAAPVSADTGTRTFCSLSDGVIRYKPNADPAKPVTITECKTWEPLK